MLIGEKPIANQILEQINSFKQKKKLRQPFQNDIKVPYVPFLVPEKE